MALVINSNIASINAQRNLSKTNNALSQTFQRLASGLRVNSAKDDAAGLAIVTQLTKQIRGMNMGVRNANDTISMLQVAEGAMAETESAMQRIRELAVQSANGSYSDDDRLNLDAEVQQLISEVERISQNTKFNGYELLGGTGGADFEGMFQVGAGSTDTLSITISAMTLANLTLTGVAVSTSATAATALGSLDTGLSAISTMRAKIGAYQSRLESIIANAENAMENTSAARARIQDADIAVESANLTKNTILQQAGVSVLAQANQQAAITLKLLSGF
ncbi:MAG: flagellin FliC [Magnetococcales bacterium]|nr:flagellin FliC [Magnetococcales bacterium]